MKSLFRRLFDKPAANQAPLEAAVVPPVVVEPSPPKTIEPKNEIADAKAKLESARCDLHPLYLLLPATVEIVLPSSTQALKIKVLRCTKARCDRHYTTEFGYFRFVPGQPSEIGEIKVTAECHLDHELRYLLVTKIGGSFFWACPEDRCSSNTPYVEVAES